MPNAHIPVRGTEHGRAGRLALRLSVPPEQTQFLARVAFDFRDANPHGRFTMLRIPLLNLIGKRDTVAGCKPEIVAVRQRLREIERLTMQSHEQREVGDGSTRCQIRPFASRDHDDRARVLPLGIRCR